MRSLILSACMLIAAPTFADEVPQEIRADLQEEFKLLGPELFAAVLKIVKTYNANTRADSASICNGRLTLTTGVPVTTSNVLAATSVYFTPHLGNRISLFNGTHWALYNFTELTLAVPATTNTNFDIFIYNNSGTLTLEATDWSGDTTRATALAYQDGVLVRSGSTTRRYLGTGRTTTASGQTEDSTKLRLLWNKYNRERRQLYATNPTASWTYNSATVWRGANGNSTYGESRVGVLSGEPQYVELRAISLADAPAGSVPVNSIAIDVTNADHSSYRHQPTTASTRYQLEAGYQGAPVAGFHFFQMMEILVGGTAAATYYGNAGGNFSVLQGFIDG